MLDSKNNNYRPLLRFLIPVVSTCLLIAFLSDVKLPLPDSEQGIRYREGVVAHCDIESLSRSGYRYFISIRISGDSKTFSANFNRKDTYNFLTQICNQKSRIKFEYIARRFLFRPQISYVFKISTVEAL